MKIKICLPNAKARKLYATDSQPIVTQNNENQLSQNKTNNDNLSQVLQQQQHPLQQQQQQQDEQNINNIHINFINNIKQALTESIASQNLCSKDDLNTKYILLI